MHPGPLLTLAEERPVQLVETVAVSFATAFEPAPTAEDVAVLPLPVAVLFAVPPKAALLVAVPPVVAVDVALLPVPEADAFALLPAPVAVLVAAPPRAADELAVPPLVAVDAAVLRKPEADASAWLPVPVATVVAAPPRTEDELALPPVVPVDVALLIESALAVALLPAPLVTVQPPLVPVAVRWQGAAEALGASIIGPRRANAPTAAAVTALQPSHCVREMRDMVNSFCEP